MKHQQIISDLPYPSSNSKHLNGYYLLTLLLSQLDKDGFTLDSLSSGW